MLARRGDTAEAERLAREAVAIGAETQMPDSLGEAQSDLAEVLTLAGKTDEAEAALREALALFERKGNLAMAERTTTRLRELARPPLTLGGRYEASSARTSCTSIGWR